MSKTITLRLDDPIYQLFRTFADRDNRPLSNFIETATKRYIEEQELADPYEMAGIKGDPALNESLQRAIEDAKSGRGHFV